MVKRETFLKQVREETDKEMFFIREEEDKTNDCFQPRPTRVWSPVLSKKRTDEEKKQHLEPNTTRLSVSLFPPPSRGGKIALEWVEEEAKE